VTAHRAQGVTTAHTVVTASTRRENLYVAITRGGNHNHAWVATDQPDDAHTGPADGEPPTARQVLEGVLRNTGADTSAHQAALDERERPERIDHLAAIHQTIWAAGEHERWASLLPRCGLTPDQTDRALRSDAFPALAAQLRRLDQSGLAPEDHLPRIAAANDLFARPGRRPLGSPRAARWVAGVVPAAHGPMRPGTRQALAGLEARIAQRAQTLARRAAANREPWLTALGPRPADHHASKLWDDAAQAVAAYRERWGVAGADRFSRVPAEPQARAHAARTRQTTNLTRQAAQRAQQAADAPARGRNLAM
jgi:hypothetical protein